MTYKKKYITPSAAAKEVKTSTAFLGPIASAGGEIDNSGTGGDSMGTSSTTSSSSSVF